MSGLLWPSAPPLGSRLRGNDGMGVGMTLRVGAGMTYGGKVEDMEAGVLAAKRRATPSMVTFA